MLATEFSDPRLAALTVSGVDVSPDLRNAKVFVTPRAGADVDQVLRALRRAARPLRRRLAARVRMKYIPRLDFRYDPTLDRAEHLEELIRKAAING